MSCKSALYVATTTPQSITVNGVVNFGSIVRRYGSNLTLSGGNVTIQGSGYYDVDFNLTVEGTTAGTAVLTVYKDGVAVPGASASIVTTDGSITSVTIPAIIREMCCCQSTITVVVSGVAVTVNSASALAEKI